MGFRFRKSINFGPFRLNFSKSGVGYSVGGKGFRVTKKAGGGHRTTASIPGTGISYVKDSPKKKASKSSAERADTAMNNNTPTPTGPKKKKKWPYVLAALLIVGVIGSLLPDDDKPSDPGQNNIASPSISSVDTSQPSGALSEPSDVSTPSEEVPENDTLPNLETPSAPEQTPASTSGNQVTPTPDSNDGQISNTPSSPQQPEPEPEPEPQSSRTVYITRTGSKYHYDNNCNGGTYIESTLDEAVSLGLEPCKKCAGG